MRHNHRLSRRFVMMSLLLIWGLGMLDLSLTLRGVAMGIIAEANPIMRSVLHSPSLAWLFKGVSTALYSAVLIYISFINHPWAAACLYIGLGLNSAVVLLHLNWLAAL